ncbi:hypothetical protein [Nocardia sp. NPDC057353]|uniref:hypothetical protein n=1 Tax=Nocardia sp. NPDC057353 TaxID=3346104 RepID=UPI003631C09C
MSEGSQVLAIDGQGPLALGVAGIGLSAPALEGSPFIRAEDGTVYALPKPLHDWAFGVIARIQATGTSPFPREVEFGAHPRGIYARLL